MIMNRTSLFLFLAACVGLCPLHAKTAEEANMVKVSLNHKNIVGSQRFSMLGPISSASYFKDVDKRMALTSLKDTDKRWFVYNIPICISAIKKVSSKTYKAATVVPELTVKVYLLYSSKNNKNSDSAKADKSADASVAKWRLLEKEITYVDIPLEHSGTKKEGSREAGYAEMSVGVFIPQTVATLMSGDDDPGKILNGSDLQIAAFAIVPKFNGEECKEVGVAGVTYSKAKRPFDYVCDATFERRISSSSKNWWQSDSIKSHFTAPEGVRLYCISETPYAPFYGTMYPATKPLYGEPVSSDGSSTTVTPPSSTLPPETTPPVTPSTLTPTGVN